MGIERNKRILYFGGGFFMFNLVNLDDVRKEMVNEIQSDIENGRLYISERLTSEGKRQYPNILLESAIQKDVEGFIQMLGIHFFNSHYPRKNSKGGYTNVTMPEDANRTLCEGEFNRFYIRGLCLKAISLGHTTVTAYRARPSKNPRPESVAIENKEFDANKLLSDLRNNPGVNTAFGLPPGPNSGMSAKL